MLYIIKYNEIILKGKNRRHFESLLLDNIVNSYKNKGIRYSSIKKTQNRIMIESDEFEALKDIMGVDTLQKATKARLDIKDIKKAALSLIKDKRAGTFKISTNRVNKSFPYGSVSLNSILGKHIQGRLDLQVDLENPDIEIKVDILDSAYLSSEIVKGPGGLPLGSSGRVISLIQGQRSILAALLMMKRGAKILPAFFSQKDLSLLEKYNSGFSFGPLLISGFSGLDCYAGKIKACVTGQTLRDFNNLPLKLPVLRPLVAYTGSQIKEQLEFYKAR